MTSLQSTSADELKGISTNLCVNVGGIKLKNPVMTASGTCGYGSELFSFVDLNRLGGMVVKGLSLTACPGNPPPRIAETDAGMLNAIGLENVGFEAFVRDKLPFLKTLNTSVVLNIYGQNVEQYERLAEKINELNSNGSNYIDSIAGLELNISCPNVKKGGLAFGTDPKMAFEVTKAVRDKTRLPLVVKLSPNVTDITTIARSVEDAGADALSVINTLLGMAVDIKKRRPKLHNIVGGLSGPAIRPIALRMVWQTVRAVKIPVIGIGGIMCAQDALEFLIAGASAIQIGTANLVNPRAGVEIVEGIETYMVENGFSNISQVIGSLEI